MDRNERLKRARECMPHLEDSYVYISLGFIPHCNKHKGTEDIHISARYGPVVGNHWYAEFVKQNTSKNGQE